jgi:hypothetical protein
VILPLFAPIAPGPRVHEPATPLPPALTPTVYLALGICTSSRRAHLCHFVECDIYCKGKGGRSLSNKEPCKERPLHLTETVLHAIFSVTAVSASSIESPRCTFSGSRHTSPSRPTLAPMFLHLK